MKPFTLFEIQFNINSNCGNEIISNSKTYIYFIYKKYIAGNVLVLKLTNKMTFSSNIGSRDDSNFLAKCVNDKL